MVTEVPYSIYTNSCPNCGGNISAERLIKGSVCETCLKEDLEFNNITDLIYTLIKRNKLVIANSESNFSQLGRVYNILEKYRYIENIFERVLNSKPIGPQRSWLLRFLNGESFAIIAPPGLGKTTFGLIMSLYNSQENKKSLVVFPTRTLVSQAVDKLSNFSNVISRPLRILYTKPRESQGENILEQLKNYEFDIFITTSRYVVKNVDALSEIKFDFIFVDDVDSALKSSKSANSILQLAGFTLEDIKYVRDTLRQSGDEENKFKNIQKIREKRLKDKVVVFSSATLTRGNPILSSLMGFRPGGSVIYLRKVKDSYIDLSSICSNNDEECIISILVPLLKRFGDGGLIYVPVEKGSSYAESLAKILNEGYDIKAVSISTSSVTKLSEFERGEISVLIGVATHYGVLVRGIDIPWRIKYAVFTGIPKFKFKIGENMHPLVMSRLLTLIYLATNDETVRKTLAYVRSRLRNLSPAALTMLAKQIKDNEISDQMLKQAYDLVYKYLEDKAILDKIAESGDVVIQGDNILIPDYLTYIQASGRTSRLYGSTLTTGLSVLFVDNLKLFEILKKKLNLVLDDVEFVPLDLNGDVIGNLSLDDILTQINSERENITKLKKEGIIEPAKLNVRTTLLIVESPNKARTIANFFSKPSSRSYGSIKVYETVLGDRILMVVASGGHIYDLVRDGTFYENSNIYGVRVIDKEKFIPYYSTIKKCSKGHQVAQDTPNKVCPVVGCNAEIVIDKTEIVNVLRKLALESDEVLIGTDPDTEGEKIAWDIYLAIRPYNSNIKRAEFHEVTRRAILNAINNSREFDVKLVKAQIVRRIEDRWLGFRLSWKVQTEFWKQYCDSLKEGLKNLNEKVRQKRAKRIEEMECDKPNPYLSAGRVQTPVLGWISKRYEDYLNNKKKYFLVEFSIMPKNDNIERKFQLLIPKQGNLSKNCKIKIQIEKIDENISEFGPLPPYTTDSLLFDATNLLRISASETMKIAQDLFELGLITYHRTDSTRISNLGISVAENYLKTKQVEIEKVFKPRSWGEGGAHEAIRPTKPLDENMLKAAIEEGDLELPKRLHVNHFRVYDLIFRRFISSQLPTLLLTKQILKIKAYSNGGEELNLEKDSIEIVTGYMFKEGDEFRSKLENIIYFPYKVSSPVDVVAKQEINANIVKSFSVSNVQLYTQGELVRDMKNKQIGRPSTYAVIISTLIKRRYVIESHKTKKLIPTDIGSAVFKYLDEKYKDIVSESRTSELLKKMNEIENGKIDYIEVLKELYNDIQKIK
ncbi:MAG: reverse gyrase [Saccharolobus sp.]